MTSTIPDPHTRIAGTSPDREKSIAHLIMLRMQREEDLERIFKALGLERGRDTVEDAVELIEALLDYYQTNIGEKN